MNLGEITSRSGSAIGLSTKTGSDELAKLEAWANEAVLRFLRETKCFVKPVDLPLTADEGDYDLDAAILAIKSLYVSGQPDQLQRTSSDEILTRRQVGVDPIVPYMYALEGENLLMLYPLPADGDTLSGLYVPRPTPMTDPAHDPSDPAYGGIPTDFHDVLESYTSWKAADWDDDTSSKIGQAYKQEWLEGVIRSKLEMNKKAGVRWGPARVKRSRRYPRSNGIDIGI